MALRTPENKNEAGGYISVGHVCEHNRFYFFRPLSGVLFLFYYLNQ